jgi:hypothetical protein
MKSILFFDTMLTPRILTLLYWFSLVCAIISGVVAIATGHIWEGLLSLIVGTIITRIGFEIIMIAFKNNEYLSKLANKP